MAASTRRGREAGHHRSILIIVAVAQLMIVLDTTVMNIALPSAQRQLGFSVDQRQWVITAYALTFGSFLLLGGRISDIVGRRLTLVIGLSGFAVVSALGGAAPDFTVLVAARALQGLFAALLAPAALSTLNVTFTEPEERGRAFAVYAAVAAGGAAIGLIVGGMLTQWLSWRSCLYINLFFALPAVVGVVRFISPGARTSSHSGVDVPGVVLGCGGLFCLVYGLSNAETHGWSAPLTMGMLATSFLLLLAFVLVERTVRNPLLPIRVVASRIRGGSYIGILLGFLSMFGAFLFLTYFLQQSLDLDPLETGFAFLPFSVAIAVAAGVCNTRLMPKVGPRPLVPVGMILGAGGMLWLHQLSPASTYGTGVLGPIVILGLGMGCIIAPSVNAATAGLLTADAGVGSAMVNTSQQIGGAIGAALLSTIFLQAVSSYAGSHTPSRSLLGTATIHGYATVFGVCAVIFLGGAIATGLLLPSGRLRPATAGGHTTAGEPGAAEAPAAAL
jgi:EmrB/QacA subfamily drug resistance transporter